MKRVFLALAILQAIVAMAEDGSQLWLRHSRKGDVAPALITLDACQCPTGDSTTALLAQSELRRHWSGDPVSLVLSSGAPAGEGAFRIEKRDTCFLLTASSATGLLYGAYFMLRAQSRNDVCLCSTLPSSHVLEQRPAVGCRWLAVQDVLFDLLKQERVSDFARACASVGINGVLLKERRRTSRTYIDNVNQLRTLLAPYGISIHTTDSLPQSAVRLAATEDGTGLYTYAVPAWVGLISPTGGQEGGGQVAAVVVSVPVSSGDGWCADGNLLHQAHWFAAGRLAWQPDLAAELLTYEWLAGTFSESPLFFLPMRQALMQCDGTTDAVQTLLNAWREVGASVDDERFAMVEKALCEQLDNAEE